jgi:hypothetical protein
MGIGQRFLEILDRKIPQALRDAKGFLKSP